MKSTCKTGLHVYVLAIVFLCLGFSQVLQAQLKTPDVHPKFVNPLPDPAVIDATGGGTYNIEMRQVVQWLGLEDVNGLPLNTTVWGYGPINNVTYPGPTFWAMQNKPINVTWKNNLPNNHLLPIDMSLHVAHPDNWVGKGIPTVAHLHGGHTESASDGIPDAWFTSNYKYKGHDFIKKKYYYSNDQEAATLWYHDHALGITRLNVYAGLAGFYLLRDATELGLGLPSGPYEREIVFQDRNFDTNGQLFMPAAGGDQADCQSPLDPNLNLEEPILPAQLPVPGGPSVEAEFFGEYIIVNGMAWPELDVEPRQYRFRLLNGSDSRFYYFEMQKMVEGNTVVVPFLQIGTDNGLLPSPVSLDNLLLAPGERADVIVDFSLSNGATITMINKGLDEPFGTLDDLLEDLAEGNVDLTRPTAQIMQFNVILPMDPGVPGTNFTTSSTLRGAIAPYGTEIPSRKLVLFEGRDQFCRLRPQLGILDEFSALNGSLMWDEPITELPNLNTIEYWDIYNTTADAHPIHLHQVAFQILDRQPFTGTVVFDPDGDPVTGGTKQILTGVSTVTFTAGWNAPPNEKGWKDTGIIQPGEVMRVAALFDLPGKYVWHCHILSHEDHEMMRPFFVGPAPGPIGARESSVVQKAANTSSASFELLQLYPNPLRDQTQIMYSIAEDVPITLTVSDMQGRIVRVLLSGMQEAGLHQLNWDGRDNSGSPVPGGMYTITMQSSDKVQSRRIVITN